MKSGQIVFYCIHCGQKISVSQAAAGYNARCPQCSHIITIPATTVTPYPAPSCQEEPEQTRKAVTNTPPQRIVIPAGFQANRNKINGPRAKIEGQRAKASTIVIIGFLAMLLGIGSGWLFPQLSIIVYSFLGIALILSLFAIGQRRVVTGAGLLFCTLAGLQLFAGYSSTYSPEQSNNPLPLEQEAQTPAETTESDICPHTITNALSPLPTFDTDLSHETNAPSMLTSKKTPEIAPEPEGNFPEEPTPLLEEFDCADEESQSPPESPAQHSPAIPLSAEPEEIQTEFADFIPNSPSFPFTLYNECVGDEPYCPSGWMGDHEALEYDDCCTNSPYAGNTCIRISYTSSFYWGGIAWQDPPNNWGTEADGGYDLTGAKKLTLWARAEKRGTLAEFKVGVCSNEKYRDTACLSSGEVELSQFWKKYNIPIKRHDNMTRIITGFACVITGTESPSVVYLDEIKFE